MIRIGRVDVSLELRQISLEGQALRVGARAFDILELLMQAHGQLVTKETLFRHVWPDTVVEENNLQVHISALRKLLGNDKDLIKTVPGRGYCLVRPHGAIAPTGSMPIPSAQAEARVRASNVPLCYAPLIGREQTLRQVQTALGRAQLVTLVGTGGIGKTQLALEAARANIPLFAAVRFVNLAVADQPESTLGAIADGLGLPAPPAHASPEWLIGAVGTSRLLIILDNCEHMIQEAATICEQLVEANPNVRILATSREPLRARVEEIIRIPPLDVPCKDAGHSDILKSSAVHMFTSRIRARDPLFRTETENISLIATICRRLDGVPLALELAAARVTTLGINEVLAQLDNRFRVLTGGLRTAPARQQTLKAALDWSHRFLCNEERTVLRRIGLFHGSFELDAACAIAARDDLSAEDVTEAIAGLVSKSLLAFGSCGPAMTYHLLETTRAYALELLAESGESDTVARLYDHYVRTHAAAADKWAMPPIPSARSEFAMVNG